MNLLLLARDVAAVAVAASMALTAVVLYSGAAGLFGGLAASMAVIAAAGLLSFVVVGLASMIGAPPLGLMAVVVAALVLAGAFFGAHYYGVRGMWVAFLSAIGAALGLLLLASAARAEGQSTALALGAPLVAFVLLAATCFAGLSVAARAAATRVQAEGRVQASAARIGPLSFARDMFGAPPDWFDCAYATLGGAAEKPDECPFNPPRIAGAPVWSAPMLAPRSPDRPLAAGELAPDPDAAAALAGADAPGAPPPPDAPAVGTPDFVAILSEEGGSPATPDAINATVRDSGDDVGIDAVSVESDAPPEPPAPAPEPSALREVASVDDGAPAPDDPTPPEVTLAAAATPAAQRETSPDSLQQEAPERDSSVFVCFPMLGAIAERLCPDHSLSQDDFELRWLEPGGEAKAPPDALDCFFDPSLALHVSLLVNLSGDLVGKMPRSPRRDSTRIRKSEAIYEMATRMIGAARAGGAERERDQLYLSMYVANGSTLLSPWASQDLGPERSDRLFDVRSSGQTLALLRRLKAETQAVRRGSLGGDIASALRTVLEERPSAPFAVGQNLIVLVTDAEAVAMLSDDEADALTEALRRADTPLFAVALDADSSPDVLARIAEESGGAGYGARDVARMADAASRAVFRARSFCSLKVTAPESLFRNGALEVRLRRRLVDGCAHEAVATLDCQGLSMSERILPDER